MKYSAVIVAAGKGTRAGGPKPKQYQMLNHEMVLTHTINAILASPKIEEVCVVINPNDQSHYDAAVDKITDERLLPAVKGGETRSASVQQGLSAVSGEFVLIHDGARPFVSKVLLENIMGYLENEGNCFAALPLTDALWRKDQSGDLTHIERGDLWRAQTPQAFRRTEITKAHQERIAPADDDVAVAIDAGLSVSPLLGSEENFKITHPSDFDRGQRVLDAQKMKIRMGTGFDVHALGNGDHVILNGIKIPHSKSMIGHSDADVAMHAITDAIFGALAEGDIGQWFPPSDPQWKGASSDIFLTKAVERVQERGMQINNIDCTIICETPKIGPHSMAMRENLGRITGLDIDQISVKATTSEKLGFTGREEGIAAQAAVVLQS